MLLAYNDMPPKVFCLTFRGYINFVLIILAQQGGEQAFEYTEVGFVPQQASHGPVEADGLALRLVTVVHKHLTDWFLQR